MALDEHTLHVLNMELITLQKSRETVIERIDRRIAILRELLQPLDSPTVEAQSGSGVRPQLKDKGLRESILIVLRGFGGPMNAGQIAREFKAKGFNRIENGELNGRISGELHRLEKSEQLERVDRGVYKIA